jgi:hypothetical protein
MWRLSPADQSGRPFGRVNLATPEGSAIWRVFSAGLLKRGSKGKFKKRKAIEKKSKCVIIIL